MKNWNSGIDRLIWKLLRSRVHEEGVQNVGVQILGVLLIAAVEGRLHVHSEYALLANVIVAGESGDISRYATLRRWHRAG